MTKKCERCGWELPQVTSTESTSRSGAFLTVGLDSEATIRLAQHDDFRASFTIVGAARSIPNDRWGMMISLFDQRKHRPVYICGACIIARLLDLPPAVELSDWLEQRGHAEAAADFRNNFTGG